MVLGLAMRHFDQGILLAYYCAAELAFRRAAPSKRPSFRLVELSLTASQLFSSKRQCATSPESAVL
jgi:hypothetical protein